MERGRARKDGEKGMGREWLASVDDIDGKGSMNKVSGKAGMGRWVRRWNGVTLKKGERRLVEEVGGKDELG